MLDVLKERKVGVIVALLATVADFTVLIALGVLISNITGNSDVMMTVWLGGAGVLAIVAYLMAGGLGVAIRAVLKAFAIGSLFPIFPINLACGFICAACTFGVVWIFPIAAVLIDAYLEAKERARLAAVQTMQ